MKISLIDTGSPRNELNEPIAIELLYGILKSEFKDHIDITLYYDELYKIDVRKIFIEKPKLIGISTKIGAFDRLKDIIESVRSIDNNNRPIILVGGVLATFAANEILSIFPEVICVIGEGEEAIVGITSAILQYGLQNLDFLKNKLVEKDVPNLFFMLGTNFYSTKRSICDLSALQKPIRYFLGEIIKSNGIVRAESSRGCPWSRCSFCTISYKYNNSLWRPFPIRYVIENLEEISLYNPSMVYFTDEEFIGPRVERFFELCQRIIDKKNQVLYTKI